ncbi:hypothetical protein QWI29_22030 [Mycolicibacterium neoaurum]|nr:hypothetical protein [Mycolicibacterium neoaurum]MDO3402728.1 hypothetical protein [Mycolicibacterium neoaurum]
MNEGVPMYEQFDELVTILSLATESAPASVAELLYGEQRAQSAGSSPAFA